MSTVHSYKRFQTRLVPFVAVLVAACTPMVTNYPNPSSPTQANVPVNRCLHLGECDGRPYPVPAYARGLDPRWASGRM